MPSAATGSALPCPPIAGSATESGATSGYGTRLPGLLATCVAISDSTQPPRHSSLERCGELVDDGWSVLIYPEGTRSTTGVLESFRSGIGLLAAELDIPVIPIGISGAHAVWPKGSRRPRPGPVSVRIGEPIHVVADTDRMEIVARLEQAVASLVDSNSHLTRSPEGPHPA